MDLENEVEIFALSVAAGSHWKCFCFDSGML